LTKYTENIVHQVGFIYKISQNMCKKYFSSTWGIVDAWESLVVLADLFKWHFLMHSGFSTKVVAVRNLPR